MKSGTTPLVIGVYSGGKKSKRSRRPSSAAQLTYENHQLQPLAARHLHHVRIVFCRHGDVVGIASTHREDLVNQNYYEQELKYQEHIDSAGRAQAAGAAIDYAAATGKILVTLPAAQLAQKFSARLRFTAPTTEARPRVSFGAKADGTQAFDAAQLAAGPWQVRAAWTANGQTYFLEEKIVVAAK